MQLPPLTFQDISILLAVTAIILLITSELASTHTQKTTLILNKKKLRLTALTLGTAFLVTVAITMANIIANLQP